MRPIDADALIEFCAERWIPLNIDAVNMQPTIQPVATDTNVGDTISRQAAIDGKIIIQRTNGVEIYYDEAVPVGYLKRLPSVQPDRKLIDDYMLKIKQNISPHTAAEGVIAITYYLDQIYEQIYGKGEKPKWMI